MKPGFAPGRAQNRTQDRADADRAAPARRHPGDPHPAALDVRAVDDAVKHAIDSHHVEGIDEIWLSGSGDLLHSALATEIAFQRLTGLRVAAMPSMRMGLYVASGLSARSAVVQMSFSGKTARAVESATLAKQAGARIWALTNDGTSPLAALSDASLVKPDTGGNEAAGYPVTMLMLLLLAVRVAELRGRLSREQAAAVRTQLARAPDDMQRTLDACSGPARALAERYADARHVLFLATGPAFASAVNGSARIHEAVGINASAQDIEEWAHLNRWIAEHESPTIAILPPGPVRERGIEIVDRDAQAREARHSSCATRTMLELGGAADGWLPVHCALPEEFCPLVYNLPGELFAHLIGVVRNIAPYREGDPVYQRLGEIRWGGWIRQSLPESTLLPPDQQP
jgi:glucosamine--fructose-6-phosphate aminotransferase (isomerizing)